MPSGLRRFRIRYMGNELLFGEGGVKGLAGLISGRHSLIAVITGRSSARVSGALADVENLLKEVGIEYFVIDSVRPNPTTGLADEIAEQVWREGADGVVAVGGGSVIDTAKFVSVMAVSGGSAEDYVRFRRPVKSYIPLYAINLTHGTGSEIDRYAVLTVDGTGEKRGAGVRYPVAGVDDPRYTLTLPESQTVYTSLDTLYHAYEAATSLATTPYTELLACRVVELLSEWLPRAVEDGRDLKARYWLLYASMIAGIAIDESPTHAIHGIEHALSGLRPELSHGAGLAIIGPELVRLTHKAVPEESAAVLKALDPSIRPVASDADKAAEAVRRFQQSVGFSETLPKYGIGPDDAGDVAKLVLGPLKYLWDSTTPFKLDEGIVKDIIRRSA